MDDVMEQPNPTEYAHKRALFSRLQDMAVQMQKMRRAMGYQWLEGGLGELNGAEATLVHARQSGLIVVGLVRPDPALHLEYAAGDMTRRIREHHRAFDGRPATEYVWDEAMFSERMT